MRNYVRSRTATTNRLTLAFSTKAYVVKTLTILLVAVAENSVTSMRAKVVVYV